MYSASSVAVDKGLGFDFSGIADLVKSALPVGLNIYQNQMQLKQVKAMAQTAQAGGFVPQSPGVYGQAYGQLPMSQVMQPQPTFGAGYIAPPRTGMDTGTMMMVGAAVIGGLVLFKMLAK